MDFLTSISNFNWADYAVIAFILISTLISLVRGFVREAISLCTWIIAFWIAFAFSNIMSVFFEGYIQTQSIRVVVSFVLLFVIVLIFGGVVNFLIGELVNKTGLSGTDRTLGTVFGFMRGILLVALLMLLGMMTSFSHADWWKHSILIPHFKELVQWMQHFLPGKWSVALGK